MQNLFEMLHEVNQAPALYKPTSIWEELLPKHLELLETRGGLYNFKATVNMFYSQWMIVDKGDRSFDYFNNLAKEYPAIDSAILENPEFFLNYGGIEASEIYLKYCLNLNQVMQGRDYLRLLAKVSEPLLGNPIRIRQGNKYLSQDLPIAYSDFLTLYPRLPDESPTILELGAGYGCLASLFGLLSKVRYWIVDIPPALFIAQEYIRSIFPNELIFEFRSFKSFDEVQSELANARFAFFTPNQLEFLPDSSIDIFANINSFGEMSTDQVENYMSHVWRLTKQLIYLRNYGEMTMATLGEKRWPRPSRSLYRCRPDWKCIVEESFDLFPPYSEPQIKTLYSKK
jgi:putative sugar O-methyltransferase